MSVEGLKRQDIELGMLFGDAVVHYVPGFTDYCAWAESLQKSMKSYFDWRNFVGRTPGLEKIHEKLDMLIRK